MSSQHSCNDDISDDNDDKIETVMIEGVQYSANVFSSDTDSCNSEPSSSTQNKNPLMDMMRNAQISHNKRKSTKRNYSSSDNDHSSTTTTSKNKKSKRQQEKTLKKLVYTSSSGMSDCKTDFCGTLASSEASSSGNYSSSSSNSSSKRKRRKKRRRTSLSDDSVPSDEKSASDGNRRRKKQKSSYTQSELDPLDPMNNITYGTEQVTCARDYDWDDEKDYEENEKEHEKHFKPKLSPFDKEIETRLMKGDGIDKQECWGCAYQDESGVGVFSNHWKNIIKMFCNGILNTQPAILAEQMYEYFTTRTVVEIKQFSEKKTSHVTVSKLDNVWSAYGMINHFFNHTLDPTIETLVELWKVKKIIAVHCAEGMIEQHDVSGRQRISKDSVQVLTQLIRIQNTLYSRKPHKMIGYNNNMESLPKSYPMLNPSKPTISSFVDKSLFRGHTNY